MAEKRLTDEDIATFMNPLLTAKRHPLLRKYMSVMRDAAFLPEDVSGYFTKQTDFAGVCMYLKVMERHIREYRRTDLGLPAKREAVILNNGKSDIITKKYLELCQKYCDKKEFEKAIRVANRAYFSALSEQAKFDALKKRCYILLQMEYHAEFLKDAISCLEINDSIVKKKFIYLLLSKFYGGLNYPEKSKLYEEKAYKSDLKMDELKDDVVALRMDVNCLPNCEAKWKSIHPEPPESLVDLSKNTLENTGERQDQSLLRIRRQLLSAKGDWLQLTDTKSIRGWTLKVTEKVPVGGILLAEKPYASVLSSQFTSYCYSCYKRCINILPCKGCAMVGFCSEKCAEDARSPYRSRSGGPGRHVYDCGGLLPCLRLDDVTGSAEDRAEILPLSHLAYTCIANTPAEVLLDYICSTGRYKNFKHQAFMGMRNFRGDPPAFFDPSDYSAVAWLYANSPEFDFTIRHNYYGAAIFLTYCLWISGYPMKWFDEAGGYFYKHPFTLTKRPKVIPASWIATCMVSHIKAARFNATKYTEVLESPKKQESYYNWLAYSIYPTISLINHSCNPNACLVFTANGGAYLYALRPIESEEEITISYGYYYFSKKSVIYRRALLKDRYLFECKCTACVQFWVPYRLTEILLCSVCKWRYLSDDKECAKKGCKKDGGFELFVSILSEKIPHLSDCLTSKSCGMEDVVEALSILKQTQDLIVSPSPTVAHVTDLCIKLIDRVTGVRTVEDIQIRFPSNFVNQSIL
ncbi:unnamed protein product [Hymenolepis diminuta]|uniref:SET domain-containing protein n=1 Tax=Hymenolepis diminuta TaxID=6216 RepID=A0A564Y836_HYMDI|nr:unnamed protein product [Hymenolepis diminuta]